VKTRPGNKVDTGVWTIEGDTARHRRDRLATEEPLEIRLIAQGSRHPVAVTMRTPGHDFELAAGFLHSEGILAGRDDLATMTYCVDREVDEDQRYNIVNVTLRHDALPDLEPLVRHFTVNSACGVCGKASIDALRIEGAANVSQGPIVPSGVMFRLPETLQSAQRVFGQTGGLHAAALFDPDGSLLALREDVGRHNAVDKLVGWALMEARLPLSDTILLVSGRTSYEILQKALTAGIPFVCAISAPSSLAVDLAREFGITLVGFLRGERCNIYSGHQRIVTPAGVIGHA
jgi:FdhD protein